MTHISYIYIVSCEIAYICEYLHVVEALRCWHLDTSSVLDPLARYINCIVMIRPIL